MMIGMLNGDSMDRTPRVNGKIGGAPWTSVAHSDPVTTVYLGDFIPGPATDKILRVSWEIRGRRAATTPILSVGQAWFRHNAGTGDAVLVESVETFHDARVQVTTDGADVAVQIQSHLTEDWEFQAKLAYDYEPEPVIP